MGCKKWEYHISKRATPVRGIPKTGVTGAGTVLDFDTPRHTAYLCRGVAAISRVYFSRVIAIISILN